VAKEGYEVLEEIEDGAWSGGFFERPGLDRVRDRVAGGGVDDSPEGELHGGMLDIIANWEPKKIAERTRRGKLQKRPAKGRL
jgi:DNA invertase Pin-like site-specific DNA recombinase